LELIGKTPVVRLSKVTKGIAATLLVKIESANPSGSVKDRIALAMIEDAERKGRLKPGGVIIEATSGNTGIGLAMVCAVKGYRVKLVVLDNISKERISLLKAYGAEIVLAPKGPADMPGSHLNVATRMAKRTPNSLLTNQYYNGNNPDAHYATTGPEIWAQTEGRIDVFVAGIGTGGTITGVARYLKERNPAVRIVGVEPEGSTFSGGEEKRYETEGIGQNFIPGTLELDVIDEIIKVDDIDAFRMSRTLAKKEGILAGGSSGAAVFAALKVARKLGAGKTVVALLPDTGRNYLSKIFSEDWITKKFPGLEDA